MGHRIEDEEQQDSALATKGIKEEMDHPGSTEEGRRNLANVEDTSD